MRHVDEFINNMKMASQQQGGDYAPFAYGHIANYDPKTHRVKVVLPSVRNEDDTPLLTGWMTLGGFGGSGWGIQIAPKGGASIENPTQGELVVIQRLDRGLGVQAVACMVWNQVNTPPFPELAPGEVGIQCAGGASLKLDKDGSATLTTQKDVAVNSQGKVTVTSQGDCTVNATGNLTLTTAAALAIRAVSAAVSNGGTIHKLVTDTFVALFNGHTHPGSNTPPAQQMDNTDLTSIFEAQ